MEKTHLLVFAADNGVVAEGVSSAPQSVTLMQTVNLTRGKTGASVLAKHFGSGITVCDVGVNADIKEKAVLNRKIAYGTQNIASGPAMTRQQAVTAILTGAKLAAETDADALGVGEMGIGNTTTSSAVLAVLLSAEVETVTGRGGGVTDESFLRKKAIIRQAIEVNRPDRDDPVDVLAKVGGFDLAAMCGAFLGAAATRRPVVIDGFISAVAALCAVRLCPRVRDYLVPSHASFEIGYRLAMEDMDLEPLFLLGMRLGEGSGCPLAFQVLSAACAVMNDMATFDQAGIDDGYLDEIRQGDQFTVEESMTIFLSGGAKNGKSTLAQELAVKLSGAGKRYYVATMIPTDEEDLARIRRHVADRDGLGFETIECSKNMLSCLDTADRDGTFLVDSATALLQNAMFPAEKNWQLDLDGANRCADELIAFVKTVKNAVVVSDFIYSDAQRYDETTELYRKSLAAIDRRLAAACDVVAEVAAGNPKLYKGALPL